MPALLASIPMRTFYSLSAFAVLSLGACELTAKTTNFSQCQSNAECSLEATGEDGLVCSNNLCIRPDPWACLDQASQREPSSDFEILVRFVDGASVPIEGFEVTTCRLLDESCTEPVGGPVVSDSNGIIRLTADNIPLDPSAGGRGFLAEDGLYLEAISPQPQFWDYLISFDTRKLVIAQSSTLTVVVLSDPLIQLYESATATAQDRELSLQIGVGFDCNDFTASGLTMSVNPALENTANVVLSSRTPEPDATATVSSGQMAFVNTRTERYTITVNRAETGEQTSTRTVFGRPRSVVYTLLYP